MKILNIIKGINNCITYFPTIWKDRDNDYYFINSLLLIKLNKIYDKWGTYTNYENDYKDKEKLKKIIDDLTRINIETFDLSEKENKKLISGIYGRIGRLIPELWNQEEI